VVTQAEKVGNPEFFFLKTVKEPKKPNTVPNPSKDRAMHEGDNPSF
jgi:hypothetical protein